LGAYTSPGLVTVAQFWIAIPGAAVTVMSNTTLLWFGCSVNVELVQLMPGGAVQFQPAPGLNPDGDTVKPGRRVSVTVVVGWHATFPTLVTVTSNTNGKPGIGGLRSGFFVIARSHPGPAVGVRVGVMVGVAVGGRNAVLVGVGVGDGLHLPAERALKMLWTSGGVSSRLKSSTSSIAPWKG
jgi:hypothetical protein